MPITDRIILINENITIMKVDAVVNAANSSLMGGGGVDGAIHRAAGPELAKYCSTLNGCITGDAKITPGFNLQSKYIIHTVGPVWYSGSKNEHQLLSSCYSRCLQLAAEYHCSSIAFPCISTGAYRFPFEVACNIALHTINDFLQNQPIPEKIFLVAYGENYFDIYSRIYSNFFK